VLAIIFCCPVSDLETWIQIHKTIILPVVLYGCDNSSHTLMEGHRLRVLQNRVLRRIFWLEREEGTGRRKLRNEELHNVYCSSNITGVIRLRRMKWTGLMVRMEEIGNYYRILVSKKPVGKHDEKCGWWSGRGKVKIKIKLSLCLTKHHIMKTYLLLSWTGFICLG